MHSYTGVQMPTQNTHSQQLWISPESETIVKYLCESLLTISTDRWNVQQWKTMEYPVDSTFKINLGMKELFSSN